METMTELFHHLRTRGGGKKTSGKRVRKTKPGLGKKQVQSMKKETWKILQKRVGETILGSGEKEPLEVDGKMTGEVQTKPSRGIPEARGERGKENSTFPPRGVGVKGDGNFWGYQEHG